MLQLYTFVQTDYTKLYVKLFIINYVYYVEEILIIHISTGFYKIIRFIYLSSFYAYLFILLF